MSLLLPHSTITEILHNCPNLTVAWGATRSPYYEQVAEDDGVPDLPYVTFEMPENSTVHSQSPAYYDEWTPVFKIYALQPDIEALGTMYSGRSVIGYLDSFRDIPERLDGDSFSCEQFMRTSWRLYRDPSGRMSGGARVWVVEAKYAMMTQPK